MKPLPWRMERNPLLLGCLASMLLTYFEYRYLLSGLDVGVNMIRSLGTLFLYQAVIFSIIFLACVITKNYITKIQKEGGRLKRIEKIGLLLQGISVPLATATVFALCPLAPIFILSITLISVGVTLYCQARTSLSISFIIWAVALYLILHSSMIDGVCFSSWGTM